jgi:geranylgeranyl pyrophosphate synthase
MSFEQIKPHLNIVSDQVNKFLRKKFSEFDDHKLSEFINIIEYGVIGSGKMIRPFLSCIIGEAINQNPKDVIKIAAAIELIHCYSLIHDDLPAMDNDDMRRGKLSTHKAFGEANAILAGDAIQSLAFEILSEIDNPNTVKIINLFAKAIGTNGLVGGQFLDLNFEGSKDVDFDLVNTIISKKTAALIEIACTLPVYLDKRYEDYLDNISSFGSNFGIAYQITDDILDAKGDASKMGKNTLKDAEKGKPNILAIMDIDKASDLANQLIENAKANIAILEEKAEPLIILTDYLLNRDN